MYKIIFSRIFNAITFTSYRKKKELKKASDAIDFMISIVHQAAKKPDNPLL